MLTSMETANEQPESEHFRELERMYLSAPLNDSYLPTIQVEHGRAEITTPVKESLFHTAGALHGSVYFKMLDDAACFAVNSLVDDMFVLTTNFTVYPTAPLSSGTLRSVGGVVTVGRTLWIAEAIAFDDDDREIARGSGTLVRGRQALGPAVGDR